DWGTGTDEAQQVTTRMAEQNPNYTIHLGDVYYVGDDSELKQHCLGKDVNPKYKPVWWRRGINGSFALNGNHEMYALGGAYFTEFLPTLGPWDPARGKPKGQRASFFCLKNKYWRVIGLDTGYYSTGLSSALSWMSKIKFVHWFRKVSWNKPSCRFPDELMRWLPSALAPDRDGRQQGVILLSHHQYYSGFDDWYVIPAEQLKPLLGSRAVLWYWGHEHRMAVYDQFATANGITAFGRCVGHGGMPVSRGGKPDIKDCDCVLYDDRKYPNSENIDVGYNGYITMEFQDANLRVNYFDLNNTLLLTESWHTDAQGKLAGPIFSNVNPDPGLIQNDPDYIRKHTAAAEPQGPPGGVRAASAGA
ncbi:MAG TPA: metallophosphoesterase, partial [Candidatus Acidoferrales bacterium]|nr:metallophosphoesterase [Candidatus Acidoferrales bacterium]